MSLGLSAVPSKSNVLDADHRRVADYHPTIWGDHFLQSTSNSRIVDSWFNQAQSLKEDLRQKLTTGTPDETWKNLNLIDAIQRLGIAYNFEREITQALEQIYISKKYHGSDKDDLHTLALGFRLLRQEGYNVSSDIFRRFKDDKGKFKQELTNDIQGMLSLYEASYLSVHGEEMLDDALAFTRTQLESMVTQLTSPYLADRISRALNRPMRKNINRLEARDSIMMYEQDKEKIEAVLKLAKLDFNMVQKMHQEELHGLTRWWKELDFATKMPFARDRLVECYFWPMGIFFEPQFALARKLLTKTIALLSVVDDIYDAYGTIEELELFTRVVESFDAGKMNELPGYLQVSYQSLLDLFAEIEGEMAKEGRSNLISYPKEEMRKLVRAYLLEARWLHGGYVPPTEEYVENALVTSVYPLLVSAAFCGMGPIASKEVFDWLATDPKILRAASTICRLMDDIVSHKFEQGRGHVASAVECYMKQHNATELQAYDAIYKLVANAWKDINEELLAPAAPMLLTNCILNFAKVINVVYKDEDSYTHSKHGLKKKLDALLLNPLAI